MIEDFLLDMEDSSGPMWLKAWRCMNCGNIYERVLQQNRLAKEAQMGAPTAIVPHASAERPPLGADGLDQLAA
ncbi:MAG: hypothetical protein R3B11_16825 [Nitrospira sp.]|jgi:hypothetical protein|nr:hypothetical protein [Nitrospira sp.]MDR4477650.1 hypothetical protein [Nitrospira sp.]